MQVLMFGWEFPPHNSGGLGVACKGLVRGLIGQKIGITFVLPKKIDGLSGDCKIVFAEDFDDEKLLEAKFVNSLLKPYITSESYGALMNRAGLVESTIYCPDLFGEVSRYGREAAKIAGQEKFDIIHAHDWLSILAGLSAKKRSRKPLVVHVHATELDRTGGHNINQQVYQIEKQGMEKADGVIAVSSFTKNIIVKNYKIDPTKIHVVHNAIDHEEFYLHRDGGEIALKELKARKKKIILFVGRITLQKGLEYLVRAGKKVLEREPKTVFVIAGSGDMERQIIEEAAELGIADRVLFPGFLRGDNLLKMYRAADLCVFPSVSEPFGIVPLEALACGSPIIISKQSGVSELICHALKVDFWDIDELANKILSVLKHPELHESLKSNGHQQVRAINWADSAQKCVEVYNKILRACGSSAVAVS